MKKFVVKRLLISIVLLFFVSMIIYGIMRCMPASFVETKAMELSQKPGAKSYDEWLQQLNAAYGLDDSNPGIFRMGIQGNPWTVR